MAVPVPGLIQKTVCAGTDGCGSRLRNRRALDLDQQPGPRKLAHADARPRTPAAGKRPVLDGAEHVHVGGHVDVVGRHVHHVLERAAGLGEHHAQVFPGRGELRLRIRDDLQIRRPAHLPGAIDRVPDLHRNPHHGREAGAARVSRLGVRAQRAGPGGPVGGSDGRYRVPCQRGIQFDDRQRADAGRGVDGSMKTAPRAQDVADLAERLGRDAPQGACGRTKAGIPA
ncbi:hypothetical protein G6F31_017315 [Rhizopus arrhizus]|nr:hypothetical protein G6F31_017315 [Rhizopus arrhizus]